MPPLCEEWEVLRRLKLQRWELGILLDVGILCPVAGGRSGEPLYCASTIDALATADQRERLAQAIYWDFDLQRPSYVPSHFPWAGTTDVPFYPFDDEEQKAWTRKYYTLKKLCAPFPYPHTGRLLNRRMRLEKAATKAFEKLHGIKREKKRNKLRFRGRDRPVELSRAGLRDLVWSKTMIRAGTDLGISEFTLRELCKRQGIPLPTRGHFNHKDPKDRPPKPRLEPLKSIRIASPQ